MSRPKRSRGDVGEAALVYSLLAKPTPARTITTRDSIAAVSDRDHRPKARVRVERQIGRAAGAILTIDHLVFTISEADVQQLAAQLVRVLEAGAYEKEARWR